VHQRDRVIYIKCLENSYSLLVDELSGCDWSVDTVDTVVLIPAISSNCCNRAVDLSNHTAIRTCKLMYMRLVRFDTERDIKWKTKQFREIAIIYTTTCHPVVYT